MLNLHADAGAILKRAWSVRFLALSFAADAAEFGVDSLMPALLPSGSFLILSAALKAAALGARFIAQRNLEVSQ